MVIVTYNRAQSLPATLDALALQDHPLFEVVVVPGPCTDDTLAVLARYPGIRIVPCPAPRVGMARNIGVQAAAGDIVAFLDDDAVPRDVSWLRQITAPYANPAVAAVGGHVWDALEHRLQWRLCSCSRDGHPDTDSPGEPADYQRPGADPFLYLAGCNMSLRRSAVVALGGFDDGLLSIYDDADMCRAILDAGLRIEVLPDTLVDHGYATNDTRDSQRRVRDPYRLIHSLAVFLGHNPPPGTTVEAVTRAAADSWRANAGWMAETGQMPAEALPGFLARIDQAVAEGLAAAAMPRRPWAFAPPDRAAFRRYRP